MQDRGAAQNDGRPFRFGPSSIGSTPKNMSSAMTTSAGKSLQDLLHPFMLSGNGIDEEAVHPDADPVEARRHGFQFGSHRVQVAEIEIRARWERPEFRPSGFDALAEGAAGQDDDFVSFGHQDAPDGQQRVEMTRRRSRSNEYFHAILAR
ncbi:MAG: hypothetical protein WDN69_02665 [Aliidongia sp.]